MDRVEVFTYRMGVRVRTESALLVAEFRAVEAEGKLTRARNKRPRIGLLRRDKGDNIVAKTRFNTDRDLGFAASPPLHRDDRRGVLGELHELIKSRGRRDNYCKKDYLYIRFLPPCLQGSHY